MIKSLFLSLLIVILATTDTFAASTQINALTAAGSAASTDQFPIDNASNQTRKLTLAQIRTFLLIGTATNDNASAGSVGEYLSCDTPNTTATVTITIATPGVVTWTSHGLTTGTAVSLTTTGALPTGLAISTTYYVIAVDANTFRLATSAANAIAGTAIATSGSQSGTHTGLSRTANLTTATSVNLCALALTAGDWEVCSNTLYNGGATTTVSNARSSISPTSATLSTATDRLFSVNGGALTPFGASLPFSMFGCARVSVASTTNYYLVGNISFLVSTAYGYGTLWARRMR